MHDDSSFIVHDSDGSVWSDDDSKYASSGESPDSERGISEDDDNLSALFTEDDLSILGGEKSSMRPTTTRKRVGRGQTAPDEGWNSQWEDSSSEDDEWQPDTEHDESSCEEVAGELTSRKNSNDGSRSAKREERHVIPESVATRTKTNRRSNKHMLRGRQQPARRRNVRR